MKKENIKKDIGPEKILKTLLDGRSVRIKDQEYYMLENNDIAIKAAKVIRCEGEQEKVEDVYLPLSISLAGFINLCESMSEDEKLSVVFNNVLSQYNKER